MNQYLSHVCIECGRMFTEHVGFCTFCFRSGTVIARHHRTSSRSDGIPEELGADELARSNWDHVPLSAYPDLRLGRGSMVTVHGGPGAGKSTFGLRAADSVVGDAVVIAAEMGLGPAMAEMCGRLNIRRPGVRIVARASVDYVTSLLESRRPSVLVIDSVQAAGSLEPQDVRHWLTVTPLQCAICVQQVNKAGEPAGVNAWSHDADVCIRVDDGIWSVTKSRFQPLPVSGPVVPKEEAA